MSVTSVIPDKNRICRRRERNLPSTTPKQPLSGNVNARIICQPQVLLRKPFCTHLVVGNIHCRHRLVRHMEVTDHHTAQMHYAKGWSLCPKLLTGREPPTSSPSSSSQRISELGFWQPFPAATIQIAPRDEFYSRT